MDRPRDAQLFRTLGLAVLTLLAGMYLVKLPLQALWQLPDDGGVSAGWLLAGIVSIPGAGITLVLAILTASAASAYARRPARDNAGTHQG